MKFSLRLVMYVCLVAFCSACTATATQAPAAPAPTARPAGVTPAAPSGQTTSAPASSLSIPSATPEVRIARSRLTQNLADAPKLINYPIWVADPSVLGDGSVFVQMAVWEAQKSDSDINNPVRIGLPVVELIYRGANGYWTIYQGMGTASDFKWRFPYLGNSNYFAEGTVRGQKAWLTTVEAGTEAAIYWEEEGRLIVVGGRYSRPDFIKIAESIKPLK
ncbi:MAG: hypothetical protein KIT87_19675 [Anaerolineae bacterium]|nr:hypothetical protein [Anaerolineae bacterium]